MSNKEIQWMVSLSEDEGFNEIFDTKEEAMKMGNEMAWDLKQDYYYIGQFQTRTTEWISSFLDAENMIEQVVQSVYSEDGEISDYYLEEINNEHYNTLEKRLQLTFKNWLDEFNYCPSHGTVENIEKIETKSE